jgi:hypothetical protein
MVAIAANNDYPVLDGIVPSWADVICRSSAPNAPTLDMKAIKAINTGCTIEIGEQREGGRVMRRTTGSAKHEGSITVYQHLWNQWLRNNKAVMPRRGAQRIYGLVHFGIQCQFTPPGSVEIFEFRIKGCRVSGRTLNGAEGTEANVVEIPLSTIEVVDVIDGEEYVIL